MRQRDRVRELYGTHRIGDYSYGAKRHRHDQALIAVLAELPRSAAVYDIGCGTGAYLRFFRSLGFSNLHGIDLAAENIEPLRIDGYAAEEGDVLALKIDSNTSDFTFSQGVIHHTADPAKAFSELCRITKSGGL